MNTVDFYTDYREFLRDWYNHSKKQFRYFSYRYFNRKAGIASPSLFREVMNGKRNLTGVTTAQFVKGLGLNEEDGRFFELLVSFNQCRSAREKERILEQMRGLRRSVVRELIPMDHYEYFSQWYHPVIREAVCILDWHGDYGLLARMINPPVKKSQARESVELLLRLGMVRTNADGRYDQATPAITTGPEVVSLAVRSLNRQMASFGTEAIDRFSPAQRDISSMTLGVSQSSYQLIKEEIQQFKRRVARIVADDKDARQVYDLNVQLFPMSKAVDTVIEMQAGDEGREKGDDQVKGARHVGE